MNAGAYPFIDIAVLAPVRARFAAGEALLVLEPELETVLWANAPGAALIGADDLISAVGTDAGLAAVARRQIKGAPGYGRANAPAQLIARIGGQAVSLTVERINLPDGAAAILLAAAGGTAGTAAQLAISGFAETGQYLAIVDDEAAVLAATEGFEDLGIDSDALTGLVADVRGERDRLIKRRLQIDKRLVPVGFARLTDSPALHLLVAVDDGEVVATPEHETAATSAALEAPSRARETEGASGKDQQSAMVVESGSRLETGPSSPPSPARTLRFLWRTDNQGRLSAISDEFLEAVDMDAARLIGRSFADLSADLGIDGDGTIGSLLEKRDTWSGRTVFWPVGEQAVPVDLAALPAYNREREFEGFRGFGVARFSDAQALPPRRQEPVEQDMADGIVSADAVEDPAPPEDVESADEAPAPEMAEIEATPRYEPPVLESAMDQAADENVIRLSDRRVAALSQAERSAFREIGDRLRREEDDRPAAFGKRGAETETATDAPVATAEPATIADSGTEAGEISTEDDIPTVATADAVTPDEAVPPLQPQTGERGELDADEVADAGPEFEPELPFRVAEDVSESVSFNRNETRETGDDTPPVSTATDTSIVDRMPVPVLIHAGDVLHYANPEFLELSGYPSLDELRAAGGLDALFAEPLEDEEDDDQHRMRLRNRDGAEFPIEALLRSVKWGAGHALMLIVRMAGGEADENTDDTLAEARARLDELRTILDTATDGVVLIDREGSIRSISRPAEALFGFDSDELAGKPFTSLFAIESQGTARAYLTGISEQGVASLLNDGREVIGREAQGRFIPLFMTIGRMPNDSGYCAVLRDVTQWKRAEEELSQSRRQAERASSQKTDFLARVSHEIRTPLNAIIGFSELMMDEKFGPIGNDRYRDYLRDINRSGNHVLDLVNDLLDITKIEAGEQEMAYEAISLNDTLAETVAMMQPQANRERVIIRSSFATRLPQIVADLRSVRQIALNVLSNAVRYTQAGGQVIISTAHEPSGDIVMRVRDTGIGMTQAEIEQALKPFKQINSLNRTRGDGTGLGLPLTKAMVEANRARFVITSAPNEGTLVEVVFPSTRVLAQ